MRHRRQPSDIGKILAVGWTATSLVVMTSCGQPATPAVSSPAPGTIEVTMQPTLTPDPATAVPDPAPDPSGAAEGGHFDEADNLSNVACTATNGVWSFTATLTNPESTPLDVTVAAFVVKAPDSAEVASKETVVTVAAGASVPVSLPSLFTEPAGAKPGDYQCLHGATVKEK